MKYELTFLVQDEKISKNIRDIIVSFKGKVEKEDRWGEKTLSYPIKKQGRAIFFNYVFDLEKSQTVALKKKLNFEENLLRYLLLIKE